MQERVAVYAGTFDPITNGHMWMIEQGSQMFDRLVVAIGLNPDKTTMFTVEERLAMICAATAHLSNIEVTHFPYKYLAKYASEQGIPTLLRGIRNINDFIGEQEMVDYNLDIDPNVTGCFLMPPVKVGEVWVRKVSSSAVKKLIGPEGWEEKVRLYVPEPVWAKLVEKNYDKRTV